jgi:hypothetical protein
LNDELQKSQARTDLQGRIEAFEFSDRTQLYRYISARGWLITRTGEDYLGIKLKSGKRFRVHFPEHTDLLAKKKTHRRTRYLSETHSIYLLFGQNLNESPVGYVGSALDLRMRLVQHLDKGRISRSSWELFEWARKNNDTVLVRILDQVPRAWGQAAYFIEGLWTVTLSNLGFSLPGVERWSASRRASRKVLSQATGLIPPPIEEIRRGTPLIDVVRNGVSPDSSEQRSAIYLWYEANILGKPTGEPSGPPRR